MSNYKENETITNGMVHWVFSYYMACKQHGKGCRGTAVELIIQCLLNL